MCFIVMRPSPSNDFFHCFFYPGFVEPGPVVRHGQGGKPEHAVEHIGGQCQDKEGIAQGFEEEHEIFNHLDYGLWILLGSYDFYF